MTATQRNETPGRPWADPLARFDGWLAQSNRVLAGLSSIAIVAAGCVLTYGMAIRYWLHLPTDWQDELGVFLLVGATFLSSAHVQAERGHVSIDVLAELLPPGADRVRRWLADLLSFLFCVFFTWKSWTLWGEAFREGRVTDSAWAPPLWIPYGLMAIGMSVLCLQLASQLVRRKGTDG